MNWVKQLADHVILTEFEAPDLEFAWAEDPAADPEKAASIATDYVKCGIKTVNEARGELGLGPVPGGDKPMIITPQGPVPLGGVESSGADKLQRFNPNRYGPGPQGCQFAPSGEGGNGPTQVAQYEEDDREEMESPIDPVRQALFYSEQAKLRALDPSNPQAGSIAGPDWTPTNQDLQDVQEALRQVVENYAAGASSYAYGKHVIDQAEFPDVGSEAQLQLLAQDVMTNSPAQFARNGRVIFYQSSTNTLVIINQGNPADSNIFRPTAGRSYIETLLKAK